MHELTFFRTWLPVIYLYGVGGIIFFSGMVVIFKAKTIKRERQRHQRWIKILYFGFFYYLLLHVFLTYAALNF